MAIGPDSCKCSECVGQINTWMNVSSELPAFFMLAFYCECVCVCTPVSVCVCSLPTRLGQSVTAGGLEHPSCLSLKHIQAHTMEAAGLVVSSLLDSVSAKMPMWHLQAGGRLFRI